MGTLLRLILVACVVLGFGYFIMYSSKVVNTLLSSKDKTGSIFYKLAGKHLWRLNQRVHRTASLNKKSYTYKIYAYFDDMIINLDMAKDDVTVTGLLTFITSISFICGLFLVTLLKSPGLLLVACTAFFYLVVVAFRFVALVKYEKREAEIMDAIDLLVSDVKGGVYNAIMRYRNAFHPNIRPYFIEFIDDIQNKGYGFQQAMLLLNAKLGLNFSEFAQKAIMYEEKADSTMEDIFSAIVETNRHRRTLRFINAQRFSILRTQFAISLSLIACYALFSIYMDDYLRQFFLQSAVGKFLIIGDITLIAWVLAYIASIKAKTL